MTERNIIYVAGLVDSGSSFALKRVYGLPWTPCVSINVVAGAEGMELIRKEYGGYYNRGRLVMNSKAIWKLLDDVYPFLRSKKRKADVLLEFRDSMEEFRRYKAGKSPKTGMPEKMKREREKLYKRMQVLNNGENVEADG